MISLFALSIFLLTIVTVLGSQFWHDVDTLNNELIASQDLPTQTTTSEVQLAEPMLPHPQRSPSPNQMNDNQLKRKENLSRKFFRKNVTLSAAEVESFKQTIIIDQSYPQNIPFEIIKTKLVASGQLHEWFDIDTYSVEKYPKYWAKVCLSFWSKPLHSKHRYSCIISVSYGIHKKKSLIVDRKKRFFDMLYCKCHNYKSNYRIPLSTPETYLIHKSGENEFYIFEPNSTNLKIKGYKGGIILPKPHDEYRGSSTSRLRYTDRFMTLDSNDIEIFNQSLTIDKSYPENISLAELEEKLMEFEDVHVWPDLQNYNLDQYCLYWGNLCVFLWGKQLDRAQRQACDLSTSYGGPKIRKLFLGEKTLSFDLLGCKCHSYISNSKKPVSSVDTFLIHQSSKNEFFIFEQRATTFSQFTLFIKGFKRVINQPNPEAFKATDLVM